MTNKLDELDIALANQEFDDQVFIEEPIDENVLKEHKKMQDKKMNTLTEKKFEIKERIAGSSLTERLTKYSSDKKTEEKKKENESWTNGASKKSYSSPWNTSTKSSSSTYGWNSAWGATKTKGVDEEAEEIFDKLRKSAYEDVDNEDPARYSSVNPALEMMVRSQTGFRGKLNKWFGRGTVGRKILIGSGIFLTKAGIMTLLMFKRNGGKD